MDIRFDGKRALVTGGGRGIGREIAQRLVICGAKTFVFTKSATSAGTLKREDPDIEVIQVDITDWESTRKAVESILPLDLLVNNAGIHPVADFLDCSESDIDTTFATNYKAAFNISQITAAGLIRRDAPGAIVNISSVASKTHRPTISIYGSSKAALDSLTKYMALELGPKRIRVNAVNPTLITTDMTSYLLGEPEVRERIIAEIPLGRPGEKREVADAVLFLLSDRAFLVNGITMPVDGGHLL